MKIIEYLGDVALNPEERKYLNKKIEKIRDSVLSGYKSDEIIAEIRVEQDKKKEFTITLEFKVPKNNFQVSKNGFELTQLIDEIEDVMTGQILRKKEKIQDLRKRGSRSIRKNRTIDEKARF